ncbi:FAD-dependent oxidoreductase [Pseudonocardia thermophila]|uniref:FAD-dependent oxidoreductase n=1 Tax=Pseudonocardia thermophila TaxID=1848 RepID=UPI001F24A36A|nr:FAD-dependent oxidoreductase [Pseudonocardia thermophila]
MDDEVLAFDVVVVGGGAAGVAAAVGAAVTGARTCLVEQHGYLGGAAVASSVLTYCGFFDRAHRQVVAGVGQLFLDRLAELDLYRTHVSQASGNKVVLLDLETTKRVLDSLLLDSGVTVLLRSIVHAADTDGDRITAVRLVHPGGALTVSGSAFIDCSGDGALLAAAGVETVVLPVEERQASTLVMRVGGVAADADLTPAGMARAVRAYRAARGVPLPRDHGNLVRLPVSGEVMVLVVDQHRDMLDVADATRAAVESRAQAQHYFAALRAGARGWETSYLAATGPELGVRETRRLRGRDVVTAEDVLAGRKRPDVVVARGGWPIEDHSEPGRVRHDDVRDGGWFDIPLGAVTAASMRNVWAAGRLVSTDRRAYASTRVMGTAFATGHAAGVAAALHARTGAVDVAAVQRTLREQGALL